jgi:hypothetical protein
VNRAVSLLVVAAARQVAAPPCPRLHDVAQGERPRDQVARLKTASGDWIQTAPSETWVTVEPNLRQSCQALAHDHHPAEAKLTQRLEQRLGLSPSSSKTDFVRMRLDHPGPDTIFRPCVDSATDHGGVPLGLRQPVRKVISSGSRSSTIRHTGSPSFANFPGQAWDTLSTGQTRLVSSRPSSASVKANL